MYVNKKILAAAIVGVLGSGSALAADLSAPGGAVPAYFAVEIVASEADPVQLGTSASAATSLNWDIGYNFSVDEVRYARLECSDNLEFDTATVVTAPANASLGAINGLGTNVLTFSLTSDDPADLIEDDLTISVDGDHWITGTDQNVNCSVALYDLPSQAQAGGTAGRIAGTVFSGAYLSFARSYELVNITNWTNTANVEADPAYTEFVPGTWANLDEAWIGQLAFRVRDPDGTGGQGAPFAIDGTEITLPELFDADTTVTVDGDFTAFDYAALNVVGDIEDDMATFDVGNGGFNSWLYVETNGEAIQESEYTAMLNAVAADETVYAVTDIGGVPVGEIVRNGTQLQAPLAQVPGGWLSRLVLTNTGNLPRGYTIAVMGETGNTITTDNLTGTVPANGTLVIDDLNEVLTGFTGAPRATLNVTVEGPNNQIQGLYQVVNPDKGSVSNHVLVRPGTN